MQCRIKTRFSTIRPAKNAIHERMLPLVSHMVHENGQPSSFLYVRVHFFELQMFILNVRVNFSGLWKIDFGSRHSKNGLWYSGHSKMGVDNPFILIQFCNWNIHLQFFDLLSCIFSIYFAFLSMLFKNGFRKIAGWWHTARLCQIIGISHDPTLTSSKQHSPDECG